MANILIHNGIIVTTFSSHIARLSTLINLAKRIGRKPILIGRSLANYISAAKRAKIFSTDAQIAGYRGQINKALKLVNKNRKKYLTLKFGVDMKT